LVSVPDFMPDPPQDIEVNIATPGVQPVPPAAAVEAAAQAARQKRIEEVIKLIQETVEPAAWGKMASVRELQGQLIVTAPTRMHEAVVLLVGQLREGRGIQVMVETKFIAVDEAVLDALPAGLREAVAGQLRAAKDPVVVTGDAAAQAAPFPPAKAPAAAEAQRPASLDQEQVDQLMRAVQGDAKSTIISAPKLMLFNGQSAYVLAANQRAYVADYTIIKLPDGSTKFEPQHGVVKAGWMLWAQATASADRKHVTLSVHPRMTHLAALEEVPWDRSPAGEKLTVSRPKLMASELSTTVSIPDGGTLLLGGLKAFAGEDAKLPATKPAVPVLMLVKPKLIIQREVEQPAFPLLNGPEGKRPAGQ
jgi:type II secretory pathway component GspD/PulD (secretin)